MKANSSRKKRGIYRRVRFDRGGSDHWRAESLRLGVNSTLSKKDHRLYKPAAQPLDLLLPHTKQSILLLSNPIMASSEQHARVPLLFTSSPPVQDSLKTESSIALSEATQDCLPLLAAEESDADPYVAFNHHGVPRLERQKHAAYLHKALGNLPPGFVMADASRPWMLYWALLGLHLLGHDVSTYRERSVALHRILSSVRCLLDVY